MLFTSQNVFTSIPKDMEVILKTLDGNTITITHAQATKLKNGKALMILTWNDPPVNSVNATLAWYLVTGIIFTDNETEAIIYFNNGNADGNDYSMASGYVRIQG